MFSGPRGDAKKNDGGKLMWDLLPLGALRKIVAVFTQGVEEYGAYSWRTVPNWRPRYYAAMQRHLTSWFHDREWADPKSGLPHLAHAGWYCLTMMWLGVKHKEADDPTIVGPGDE